MLVPWRVIIDFESRTSQFIVLPDLMFCQGCCHHPVDNAKTDPRFTDELRPVYKKDGEKSGDPKNYSNRTGLPWIL